MRLINADALGIGSANRNVFNVPEYADGWNSAIEIIKTAPTVDAVPVVRCKDCKHRVKYSCDTIEFFECDHMGICTTRVGVKDDFYCADGERGEC